MPPQAVQEVGAAALGSTPITHGSVQMEMMSCPPSALRLMLRHTPAHGSTPASSTAHGCPMASPGFGVVTHTPPRGSQCIPVGHWLSSPQSGRQANCDVVICGAGDVGPREALRHVADRVVEVHQQLAMRARRHARPRDPLRDARPAARAVVVGVAGLRAVPVGRAAAERGVVDRGQGTGEATAAAVGCPPCRTRPGCPEPVAEVVAVLLDVVWETVWVDEVVVCPPVPVFELPPQPTAVTAASAALPPTNASKIYFQVMIPPR